MKVLFVATVRSHIGQFHMPFIRQLKANGVEVHAAFRDNSADKPGLDLSAIDKTFEVPFERQPLKPANIKAYKALKKIIDENNYDAVHCHTPMGAVITRLAAKNARKNGTKVIYTAHGFHFFKGASKKNWLMFYPIEKYLSKYTDCLITINSEDYELAKEKGFSAKMIRRVHGVGVELDRFKVADKAEKSHLRAEYGYSDNDFIMIFPANLLLEKGHPMLFDALEKVVKVHDNVKLILPGLKTEEELYSQIIRQKGLEKYVDFLGYRRDIDKLAAMSDISVTASRREGLPVNLIEAMAVGNPIVATRVRGNTDIVEDGVNGYIVDMDSSDEMAQAILKLIENPQTLESFGKSGLEKVKTYSTAAVNSELLAIYAELGLEVEV